MTLLSEPLIINAIARNIREGRVMDPVHWEKTYGLVSGSFARLHDEARGLIAAEIAEADEENAVRAVLRDRVEEEQ